MLKQLHCSSCEIVGKDATESVSLVHCPYFFSNTVLDSTFHLSFPHLLLLLKKLFLKTVFTSGCHNFTGYNIFCNPDSNIFLPFLYRTPSPILIFNDFTSCMVKQEQKINCGFENVGDFCTKLNLSFHCINFAQ